MHNRKSVPYAETQQKSLTELNDLKTKTATKLAKISKLISDIEKKAQSNIGYPTLDATRIGLQKYASGENRRNSIELNMQIEALYGEMSKNYPDFPKAQTSSPQEEKSADELFGVVEQIAKTYVSLSNEAKKLESNLLILNRIISEKESSQATTNVMQNRR